MMIYTMDPIVFIRAIVKFFSKRINYKYFLNLGSEWISYEHSRFSIKLLIKPEPCYLNLKYQIIIFN